MTYRSRQPRDRGCAAHAAETQLTARDRDVLNSIVTDTLTAEASFHSLHETGRWKLMASYERPDKTHHSMAKALRWEKNKWRSIGNHDDSKQIPIKTFSQS